MIYLNVHGLAPLRPSPGGDAFESFVEAGHDQSGFTFSVSSTSSVPTRFLVVRADILIKQQGLPRE